MRRVAGLVAGVVAVLVAGCTAGAAPAELPAAAGSAAGGPTGHSGHPTQPSTPPAAPLRAGEWFVRLAMAQPYTPSPPNGGTDDYRCFLVDPKLTKPAFLVGSQFLPQNADIVHHAIFFRVAPAEVADARRLDAATPGEGWTCFGGTGIGGAVREATRLAEGTDWVAAWAPGSSERTIGTGAGYALEPGSQLVMQVHYNLLVTGGRAAGTDQSGIRLRLMDGTAHLAALRTTLLPAPVELPCPRSESGPLCDRQTAVLDVMRRFGAPAGATVAGLGLLCGGGRPPAPGPVQHCDRTVHEAGAVYAVAGHMHLLGRAIKIELNPDKPGARVLLDQPNYDFDNQSMQLLPQPVQINRGDTVRVTCTHDAALRSQLPELKPLKPRYVVWGDGTSDEMCLGLLVGTAKP